MPGPDRRPAASAPNTVSKIEQLKDVTEVVRAVQLLNRDELDSLETRKQYTFLMDRATNRPVVRVIDKETGRVLYQIPPEEVLRKAAELRRRMRNAGGNDDIGNGF